MRGGKRRMSGKLHSAPAPECHAGTGIAAPQSNCGAVGVACRST